MHCEIEVDSTGMIRRPDLHDGLLTGLRLQKNGSLQVDLITSDDYPSATHPHAVEIRLVIPKVKAMRASNFMEGNIVASLLYFRGCDPELEALRDLLAYYDPSNSRLDFQDQVRKSILRGETGLFWCTASYGCHLAVHTVAELNEILCEIRHADT